MVPEIAKHLQTSTLFKNLSPCGAPQVFRYVQNAHVPQNVQTFSNVNIIKRQHYYERPGS